MTDHTRQENALGGAVGFMGFQAVMHGPFNRVLAERWRWGRQNMTKPKLLYLALITAGSIPFLPTYFFQVEGPQAGTYTAPSLLFELVVHGLFCIVEVAIIDVVALIVWGMLTKISEVYFHATHTPEQCTVGVVGHFVSLEEAQAGLQQAAWDLHQLQPNLMIMGAATFMDPSVGMGAAAGAGIMALQEIQTRENNYRMAAQAAMVGQPQFMEHTPFVPCRWFRTYTLHLLAFSAIALIGYAATWSVNMNLPV